MELLGSRHATQPHLNLSCRPLENFLRTICAPTTRHHGKRARLSSFLPPLLQIVWMHCRTGSLSAQGQCEVHRIFHHQYYLKGHRVCPCQQCCSGAASVATKPASPLGLFLLELWSHPLPPSSLCPYNISKLIKRDTYPKHIKLNCSRNRGSWYPRRYFPLDQEHGGISMILLKIKWTGENWRTHLLHGSS